MACSSIHLAVTKRYLEKNGIPVTEDYLKGSLCPDVADDKDKTHYTDKYRGKDNVSHLKGKVNLYSFLLEHEVNDDFERGWFIHLITDYLFFDECLTKEYLLSHSYEEFCKDLYHAYACLSDYVTEKYNLTMEDYTCYTSEYYPEIPYEECIFTKKQIGAFIERVSSINLEKYILKIKENKGNIKP